MSDSRFPTILYTLMLALGLLQWVHVYPQLPAVMASHFTAHGTPNGWMPKTMFFLILGIVVAVSAIPTFVAPWRIASLPPDKINLPNKSHWLAPERCEETWAFLRAQMAWFGCGLLFVLLYGTSQAINTNLPSIGHFNWQGMLYVLFGFLVFCVLWIAHFLRHFYGTPKNQISSQSR